MDPKTGRVHSQLTKQVLPPVSNKSQAVWNNFPVIASKRVHSDEAITSDPEREQSCPKRKRRATTKGKLNTVEIEEKKKWSADRQNQKLEKVRRVTEKAKKAIAIVTAHAAAAPKLSSKPAPNQPIRATSNMHTQLSKPLMFKAQWREPSSAHGSSSEADPRESCGSDCESHSSVARARKETVTMKGEREGVGRSESDSDASITLLAAEDAARVSAKMAQKRSQMTSDLLSVFSEVHVARHPKSKIKTKCRTCLICK